MGAFARGEAACFETSRVVACRMLAGRLGLSSGYVADMTRSPNASQLSSYLLHLHYALRRLRLARRHRLLLREDDSENMVGRGRDGGIFVCESERNEIEYIPTTRIEFNA